MKRTSSDLVNWPFQSRASLVKERQLIVLCRAIPKVAVRSNLHRILIGQLPMRSNIGWLARMMAQLQNVFCPVVRAQTVPKILVAKNGLEKCGAHVTDVCKVGVAIKL